MEEVIFKHKSLVIENISPFMMTIIKIRKQRAERMRAKAQRVVREFGLRIDREIMKDITDG